MRFYRDGLGFGGLFIMRRFGMGDPGLDYPPHAIAFNIWAGPKARQQGPEGAGLRSFDLVLPDSAALSAAADRLNTIEIARIDLANGFSVADPAGNSIRLVVAR